MSAVSVILAPNDEAFGERISDALSRRGHTARILRAKQSSAEEGADDESIENGSPEEEAPNEDDRELVAFDDIGDDASIIVWSNAALKLATLHEQAREALDKGALIPVAVDGAAPPSEFESLPPIDLSEWGGEEDDPRWRFVLETLAVATSLKRAEAATEIKEKYYTATPGVKPPRTPRRRPRKAKPRGIDPNAVAAAGVASLCLMTGAAIIITPSLMQKPQTLAANAPVSTPASAADPRIDLAVIQPALPENTAPSSGALQGEKESSAPVDGFPEGIGEGDISYPEEPVALEPGEPIVEPGADAIHLAMLGPIAPPDPAPADPAPQEETLAGLGPAAPSVKPDQETNPSTDNMDSLLASVPEISATGGDIFRDCESCPDMAVIAAGAFAMGPLLEDRARSNEGPAREITLANPFAIATREVTFAEWDACVADGGCAGYKSLDHGWGRGEQPVVSVSYDDATRYAAWLTEKTGHVYRLPSEAEWEYAARAGTSTAFSFGDGLGAENANYDGRYVYAGKRGRWIGRPKPAASYPANAFGLHDMHGNVWEWTADCWSASLAGAPSDGSPRGGNCASRVLKGGAFNTGGWRLRAAHRIGKPAKSREMEIGFRVVRDLG